MEKNKFINQLEIKSFRGIRNLFIPDCNKINIIAGLNNCGKTTVLEAIRVLFSLDIETMFSIGLRNENKLIGGLNSLRFLYPLDSNTIRINYKLNDCNRFFESSYSLTKGVFNEAAYLNSISEDEKSLRSRLIHALDLNGKEIAQFNATINRNGKKNSVSKFAFDFSVFTKSIKGKSIRNVKYMSPYDHFKMGSYALSKTLKNPDYKRILISFLKYFDERITDIFLVSEDEYSFGNEPEILFMLNNKLSVPVNAYGDGIKKIICLACAIAEAESGILLIDELETSLHHSMLENMIFFLVEACEKFNVQLFITSHSKETIDTFVLKMPEGFDKYLNIYTLIKHKGNSYVRKIAGSTASSLINNINFEVRD